MKRTPTIATLAVTIAFFAVASPNVHAAHGSRPVPTAVCGPDKCFEKAWALATLEQALARVRAEYATGGRGALYERLSPFLLGETPAGSRRELAQQLGLTETALRMAVSRLRRRCREALHREVAQTVEAPEDVDEEFRHLLSALQS